MPSQNTKGKDLEQAGIIEESPHLPPHFAPPTPILTPLIPSQIPPPPPPHDGAP
jgi:hypothetical protein